MAAHSLRPWVNVDRIDLEQIRRPKRSDDGHVEEGQFEGRWWKMEGRPTADKGEEI